MRLWGIAEEPFLVGIQNANKPHFRDIKTLPEEVNSNQDIELTQPQFADNFCTLECLNF